MIDFFRSIPAGGTVFNSLAVVVGCIIGIYAGRYIPERIQRNIYKGFGLFCLYLGISMGMRTSDFMAVMVSFIVGDFIGEVIDLDRGIRCLGDSLKNLFKSGDKNFTQGFVTASLLFCTGSMGIIGALEDGLKGDPTLLVTKGIIDGSTSLLMASARGIGVAFASLPLLVYQGSLTLLSGAAESFITPNMLDNISGTGGIMILGIGLNLLGITELKTGNMIPGILVAALYTVYFC